MALYTKKPIEDGGVCEYHAPYYIVSTLHTGIYEALLMDGRPMDHQPWEMKILHGVKTHSGMHHKGSGRVPLLARSEPEGVSADQGPTLPLESVYQAPNQLAVSLVCLHTTLPTEREPTVYSD